MGEDKRLMYSNTWVTSVAQKCGKACYEEMQSRFDMLVYYI